MNIIESFPIVDESRWQKIPTIKRGVLKGSFMNMVETLQIFVIAIFYCSSLCAASQRRFNLSSSPSSGDLSPPRVADSVAFFFGPPLTTTRWLSNSKTEDKHGINESLTKEKRQTTTKVGAIIKNLDKKWGQTRKRVNGLEIMKREKILQNKLIAKDLRRKILDINDSRLRSSELIKMNNNADTYRIEKKKRKRQYSYERKSLSKAKYRKAFFHSRHAHKNLSKKQDDFAKSVPFFSSFSHPFLPYSSSSYASFSSSSSSSFPNPLPAEAFLRNASSSSSSTTTATLPSLEVSQQTDISSSLNILNASSFPSLSYSSFVAKKNLVSKPISSSSLLSSSSSSSSSPSSHSSLSSSLLSSSLSFSSVNTSTKIVSPSSSEIIKTRVNVVDENPSLDVGPLILLTVTEGSTARLPCSQSPLSVEHSVRLILWYRNDTSRPLLSYDARESQKPRKSDIFARSKEAFQRRDFVFFFRSKWMENEPRISLGRGGESLILLKVRNKDQAEYRCTVHYKRSPSVTYRLQLLVTNKIANVHIYDSAGFAIASNYGPFSEGSEISLSCKANCSSESTKIKRLNWLIGGDDLWSEWKKVNSLSGISNLRLKLQKTHAENSLTCRLTCEHQRFPGSVHTTIVDKSVDLNMLYVPQVRLFIDGASSKEALWHSERAQGGGIEVLERKALTFVCLVRSSPKAYNITWLKDGQVIDLRRESWERRNNTLVIPKIHQKDFGLFTCVASNSEGDGQSNAINIRVSYPPYCKGPNNKHFTIGRNSSIVLQCNVNAYPSNVTFSWRRTNAYPIPKSTFDSNIYSRGSSNGDHSMNNRIHGSDGHPHLIELVPENIDDLNIDRMKQYPAPQGPPLPHHEDPEMPTRSLLTLIPDAEHVGIVCLSRNEIGRTREPCHFRISVIDSPDPPIGCHVNSVGVFSLKVDCKLKASTEDLPPSQQTPGLSPVRSPGIKGASVLEVWSMGTLVTNLTSDRGHWYINKLPPDTDLRLRIYSLSPHVASQPVVLFAKTHPMEAKGSTGKVPNMTDSSTGDPSTGEKGDKEATHLLVVIGGIILGVFLLLVIILSALLVARIVHRRKRSQRSESAIESEEQECSIGEGDPWSAKNSYPESYDTIATSPL